jgi:dTDP-4-dehydrorhamnose reductase
MTALRIACIGKHGQTAQAIAAAVADQPAIDLHQAGREIANLADPASLEALVRRSRAHVVINAGAYNFVDRAESENEIAFAVNGAGPTALARLCRKLEVQLIHMSTDCVFDGAKTAPYVEDDPPAPLSVYGASKRAGELGVAQEYPQAVTARVCWVFSEFADNFVSRMIDLARTRATLRVVCDQIGPPTYAPDIAAALLRLARAKVEGASDIRGLLHLASPDTMSRVDMARAIMACSRRRGGPFAEIEAVTSAAFDAPARRPLNARLSGAKATAALGLRWTPWAQALEQSVARILART